MRTERHDQSSAEPPAEPAEVSGTRSPPRLARELMDEYAVITGLVTSSPRKRYLWTDAFAVCNYLGLYRATGEGAYQDLALRLVDQVHHTLGRHREGDPRRGWIGRQTEAEGELHPTRGGLRIGKERPERGPHEHFDPQLEWERDGQYFHYLTQWMHALERGNAVLGNPTFHGWALELALAAHQGFYRLDPYLGRPRLVWKMSIELDRVLVPSMGQHDPLDGLVSYLEISTQASDEQQAHSLDRPIAQLAELCVGADWVTSDPLGVGGLAIAAYRLGRLVAEGRVEPRALSTRLGSFADLLRQVLAATRASLHACSRSGIVDRPASQRLAFRELGLAIGLTASRRLAGLLEPREWPGLAELAGGRELADRIVQSWSEATSRDTPLWCEHREIDMVMLATSLAPDGFLGRPHDPRR